MYLFVTQTKRRSEYESLRVPFAFPTRQTGLGTLETEENRFWVFFFFPLSLSLWQKFKKETFQKKKMWDTKK